MHRTFPTARFGKTGASSATAENEYRLFYSSAGFPRQALREFERLAVSMQWSGGGGDEPYDACFALWPLAEGAGTLVGRFSDAGADPLGRPHTVLVEAALLDTADVVDSPIRLANLLVATNWPNRADAALDGELSLNLCDEVEFASDNLRQAFAEGQPPQRIFVASHPCYRVRGFDLVLETCPPSKSLAKFPSSAGSKSASRAARPKTTTRTSPSKSLQIACGLLLLLACLVLGAVAYRLNESLRSSRQELQQERQSQPIIEPAT